jgi:hypothetical protein
MNNNPELITQILEKYMENPVKILFHKAKCSNCQPEQADYVLIYRKPSSVRIDQNDITLGQYIYLCLPCISKAYQTRKTKGENNLKTYE